MSSPERISADVDEILVGLDAICADDLDDNQLRDVRAACRAFIVWADAVARRRRIDLIEPFGVAR